ncbi:MFS sugar transporter-like protein [Mollisia scopiformis]|uniref:MFS sugar transporter-like protein n=1 Tax=Mollisia scopiformis TaxID=149040 RepID=A0A194XQ36_MOLSC|nr:MFS sugar transporter-like protein [Mollisia scopiformis]KUJ21857.1 MFS sugar transporter-like protein [Mollisia scopiformis]
MRNSTLGKLRAYWLGCVVCMGGFLFGYDSGILGGVLTLSSFVKDFQYSKAHQTRVNSLAVGLQQAGAFLACLIIWPIADYLGRKKTLMLSSAIFCIGAIIETINTHSMAAFYVGRVVAGIGLGSASVVVPMFSSEMAPKELRGRIGSFFQLFYTFGIFTSYWVDYAVLKRLPATAQQWQIPIALQLVPAGLLGIGMFTLKESTRWLTKKGHHDEAWESLVWIRADESQATVDEMEEIRMGVEIEARETEGLRPAELLERSNITRLATAAAVFTAQQATGATAFAYFGPQYFKLLVNGSASKNLLLTAIFGAIKVAACLFFVLFLSDRIGRRKVLIAGAAFMAACQITTAAVVKAKPAGREGGEVTSSGIATVALIYMFVIAYNLSWGPLPWPYVSEIFPTRIREIGIATGVASQWLFNFVFSLTTPYMISNLGWGTFLLWGLFDAVIAVGSWAFLRETRGLSLEEISHGDFGVLVGGKAGDERVE